MKDAIETVLFWVAAVTGSSMLIALCLFIVERCIRASMIYLDMYEDFIAYIKQRRREGRT